MYKASNAFTIIEADNVRAFSCSTMSIFKFKWLAVNRYTAIKYKISENCKKATEKDFRNGLVRAFITLNCMDERNHELLSKHKRSMMV